MYFLEKARPNGMSTMKLQKLCYYAQAWHLAWDEVPLFSNRIEAWANGPVIREVYEGHRGEFSVSEWLSGNSANLAQSERETADAVWQNYGSMTGHQLSILTHSEAPWRDARSGLSDTTRSNREITQESLQDYYGALAASEQAVDVEEIDWSDFVDPRDLMDEETPALSEFVDARDVIDPSDFRP
jgi:uncharacterized phage-associated protein